MFNKWKYASRRKKPFVILFFGMAFIAFIVGVVYIVMLLWNNILPEVTGVKPLSFWQAAGILLLSKILFSGFGGGKRSPWKRKGSDNLRSKWQAMSETERQEAKTRWKERCGRSNTTENGEN